jgi:hypothetical protein
MPMHDLVHNSFHSRLLAWLRLPSFAGDGLPERLRSTTFALLGLTAAGGLALVAIFAQPSFTLLTPAPLPAEPSLNESIAGAEKVPLDHGATTFAPAAHAASPQGASRRSPGSGTSVHSASNPPVSSPPGTGTGTGGGAAAPGGVDASAPVPAPEPSGGKTGGGAAGNEPGGRSDPVPTVAPAPVASPHPPPDPAPPHTTSPPKATTASAPAPESAAGPGHSSSAAAASHAGERGIEASAGSGPRPSIPAAAPSAAPEPPAEPGNGNGLAKGHYK